MSKKQTVIISSVSDCREKNGIVTFMQILARNSAHFASHGMMLAFSNYVDFSLNDKQTESKNKPHIINKQATVARVKIITRIKRKVRAPISRHPFLAFLLFLLTLGARGLVTAFKARKYDEPGCVHFYQDFLTASFGYFLHHKTARNILILHSSADSLKHFFIHFSGMVGTRYEKFVRHWFDWTLRNQQCIVTLSEGYAKELRERYPNKEIKCIYNTSPFTGSRIVASTANGAAQRIRLVAIGSLQYIKGFDLLIKAIASIPKTVREKLEVTIVGGGPDYADLAELIVFHQLGGVITLAGESNDVASFLAVSDAYILTSRDEGLPISLIEACSFGLPIISTAVGSIPELFDDSSCAFMEPSEISIADTLMSLCSGRLDLEHLSSQSLQIFDSKLSLEKFLFSYVDLLGRK
jgi:glycosyltransferase involved in cell wall biosynthesis